MFNKEILLANSEKYPDYWGYRVMVGKAPFPSGTIIFGAGTYEDPAVGYDRNIVEKLNPSAPTLEQIRAFSTKKAFASTISGVPIDLYINDQYFETYKEYQKMYIRNPDNVYQILKNSYENNEYILLYLNKQYRSWN